VRLLRLRGAPGWLLMADHLERDPSNYSCLACWDSAIDPEDGNWCRDCCWDQRVGLDDVPPLPGVVE